MVGHSSFPQSGCNQSSSWKCSGLSHLQGIRPVPGDGWGGLRCSNCIHGIQMELFPGCQRSTGMCSANTCKQKCSESLTAGEKFEMWLLLQMYPYGNFSFELCMVIRNKWISLNAWPWTVLWIWTVFRRQVGASVCICPLSGPDGVAWGSSSVVGVSVPLCTRWTLPCKGAGAERMHPQNLAQRLAPAVTIKVVTLITVGGGDNAHICWVKLGSQMRKHSASCGELSLTVHGWWAGPPGCIWRQLRPGSRWRSSAVAQSRTCLRHHACCILMCESVAVVRVGAQPLFCSIPSSSVGAAWYDG